MDFLDPKKTRRATIMLFTGYVLIGILITLLVIILFYVANGMGLGKNHQIIQKGLVFVSSTPSGSQILLDGELNSARTNTRLNLPEGSYDLSIRRPGYRAWQRTITVAGNTVVRYDYPFLFPITLESKTKTSFDSAPTLASQSPDHRWLIVQASAASADLSLYDLDNSKVPVTPLTLPETLLTSGTNEHWKALEWADDNTHLLAQHFYNDTSEYILIDRSDAAQSVNLTKQLNMNPTTLKLFDKKYDSFLTYFSDDNRLQHVTLKDTTPEAYLTRVLAYQTYSDNTVLYVTDEGAPADKAFVRLKQGDKTYDLKTVARSDHYVVNLTRYSGDWYVAFGASSENKVYVYKNPVDRLNAKKDLIPVSVLRITNPTYLAFSSNTQYIAAENGNSFAVYDAEYGDTYVYTVSGKPFDAGQDHANWMDGNRLMYVSGGSLVVFDYDKANLQTLVPASPNYTPFFDGSYKNLYTLTPTKTDPAKVDLMTTSLRTSADQ